VNNDEQADQIIEKYNGQLFKDTPIKLEKALPRTKGEEGSEEQPQTPKPVLQGTSAPVPSSNKEGGRREKSKKSRRGGGGGGSARETAANVETEAIRPDPRWAAELEKLKEMLAAQATN
jgi:hypothetical protein